MSFDEHAPSRCQHSMLKGLRKTWQESFLQIAYHGKSRKSMIQVIQMESRRWYALPPYKPREQLGWVSQHEFDHVWLKWQGGSPDVLRTPERCQAPATRRTQTRHSLCHGEGKNIQGRFHTAEESIYIQLKMHFYVTIRQVARKYNYQLDDKQLSIVGIAVSNRLKDHRPHQKVMEGKYRVNCFAIHNERLILEELGKYSELLTQRCDEAWNELD